MKTVQLDSSATPEALVGVNAKVGDDLWLGGVGKRRLRIMFVQTCVTPEEVAEEIEDNFKKVKVNPAIGHCPHWINLKMYAELCGLDVEGCYSTALVKHLPESVAERKSPKASTVAKYLPWLEEEIARVKPKIIVCIGKPVFDALSGIKFKESDIHGLWYGYDGVCKSNLYFMPGMHLALSPEMDERYRMDFTAVKSMYDSMGDNGEIPLKPIHYEVVSHSIQLENLVGRLERENAKVLSVDCEWGGQVHVDGMLRSLQIAWSETDAVYIRFMDEEANYAFDVGYREAGRILAKWLDRPDVKYIGHHLSADLSWMHHWLGLKWYDKGLFDTEFALQACDEALELGLDILALRYTDFGKYDWDLIQYRKKHPERKGTGYEYVPDDILIPYACLRGDSSVVLEDGTTRPIGKMYKSNEKFRVKCLDCKGKVVSADVLKIVRNPYPSPGKWYKLRTVGAKGHVSAKAGVTGPSFTPDHNILTQRGYIRVDQLVPGVDRIATEHTGLSHEQKEMIFGCLLGDMGIATRNNAGSGLVFSQSAHRKPYADWKASSLACLHPAVTATNTNTASYRTFYSPCVAELVELWPRYSGDKHKKRRIVVTKPIVAEWLTDLAIACWYQDDGTLAMRENRHGVSYNARIYFKSINGDHEVLLNALRARFGEVNYLHKNRMFSFTVEATRKLHECIHRYVHPCMQYKLRPEFRTGVEPAVLRDSGKIYYALVEAIVEQPRRKETKGHGDPDKYSYCLEVREHGNFLTKAGFVANCKDVLTVYRAWPQVEAWLKRQPTVKGRTLLDYYNEILNPFVTNVFTWFCINGMPIDRNRLDLMRELYNWAKGELQKDFRKSVEREAGTMLGEAMEKAGAGALLETVEELVAAGDHGSAEKVLHEAVMPDIEAGNTTWSWWSALLKHYIIAPEFNIRSPDQMRNWLFKVKKYTPVKTTSQKENGMPSIDWEKVLSYPPSKQAKFTPAVDKVSIEIFSSRNNDAVLRELLELNSVGNVCKAFLKEDDVDEDGNLVKENGIHYWVTSDDRLCLNHSTTETGRPRSWNPNVLNYPSWLHARLKAGMKRIIADRDAKGQLPDKFKPFLDASKIPTVRSIAMARPGWCIVEADYQTAEMRGLAWLSGDKEMQAQITEPDPNWAYVDPKYVPEGDDPGDYVVRLAFPDYVTQPEDKEKFIMTRAKDGKILERYTEDQLWRDENGKVKGPRYDFHWGTAERGMHKCREIMSKKKDRGAGKVLNFSSGYGGKPPSLKRKVDSDTGENIAITTVENMLQAIYDSHIVASRWLEMLEKAPKKTDRLVAASGRIRHLHTLGSHVLRDDDNQFGMSAYEVSRGLGALGRECRNYFMQESVGASASRACVDLVKFALDYRPYGLQGGPIVCLYDSVVVHCPVNERAIWQKALLLYMTLKVGWAYNDKWGLRVLRYPSDCELNAGWSTAPEHDEAVLLHDASYEPTPENISWIEEALDAQIEFYTENELASVYNTWDIDSEQEPVYEE